MKILLLILILVNIFILTKLGNVLTKVDEISDIILNSELQLTQ